MAEDREPHSPDELRSVSSITAKPRSVQRLGKRAIFLAVGIFGLLAFAIFGGIVAASNAKSANDNAVATAPTVREPSKDEASAPSDITQIPPDRLPSNTPRTLARRETSEDGVVRDRSTPLLEVTPPPLSGSTPNLEAARTYQDTVVRNVGPVGSEPQAPVTNSKVDIAQAPGYPVPLPSDPAVEAARQARAEAIARKAKEATDAAASEMVMRPTAVADNGNGGTAPAAAMGHSASLMSGEANGPSGGSSSTADQATAAQLEKLTFLSAANTPSTLDYLGTVQREAISPYEIVAGKVIPVALVSGINSDIPGLIVAQVRKDIYDSRSGRYCLVPKGATLIAQPDTRVVAGQRRIVVAFSRIIFPDTSSQGINGFQGADLNGYGGLSGKANTHLNRILGKAVLEAVLAGAVNRLSGTAASSGTTVNTGGGVQSAASQIITDTSGAISGTPPTIEIQEGYRFNVVVNRDWILRGPWTGSCSG